MPANPKIARVGLHKWEEPFISGTNGSGTVFFSGCSLKCVFCQNSEISAGGKGIVITPESLAEQFKKLEQMGAHNINFVSPSHYITAIKEALKIYKPKIPLVYNSGGYDKEETINEDIFDIYLMDLKYLSNERALKYSGVKNYPEIAANAIIAAYKNHTTPVFNSNGIMQSGLAVRHLVLPQGTREAMSVVDWFMNNTPNAYLSIMGQYVPCNKAEQYKEINRKITKREYNKVLDYALQFNNNNILFQSLTSAKTDFIPDFNFEG